MLDYVMLAVTLANFSSSLTFTFMLLASDLPNKLATRSLSVSSILVGCELNRSLHWSAGNSLCVVWSWRASMVVLSDRVCHLSCFSSNLFAVRAFLSLIHPALSTAFTIDFDVFPFTVFLAFATRGFSLCNIESETFTEPSISPPETGFCLSPACKKSYFPFLRAARARNAYAHTYP